MPKVGLILGCFYAFSLTALVSILIVILVTIRKKALLRGKAFWVTAASNAADYPNADCPNTSIKLYYTNTRIISIVFEACPEKKLDGNGFITVYHRTSTSVDNAENNRRTGRMSAKEDGLFFSTKELCQNEGYTGCG